jgi:hypothetical protein
MDQMHQNYCLTNLANVVLKLLLKMMSMSALTSRVTKMDNVVLKSFLQILSMSALMSPVTKMANVVLTLVLKMISIDITDCTKVPHMLDRTNSQYHNFINVRLHQD